MPQDNHVRIFTSFFLLGLINNVLYVIILSAALDLVGPDIPKGLVLLADVLPSFFVKLTAPYYIHVVPYSTRTIGFVAISFTGMLVIALTPDSTDSPTIMMKLFGVALASLSSGGGELSFLGLTHYFGQPSLAAWSSGTGAAGLVGAGIYVLATTTLGLSSMTSLLAFSFLPLIMLASFFLILPRHMIKCQEGEDTTAYVSLPTDDELEPTLDDAESTPPTGKFSSSYDHRKLQIFYSQLKANLYRARGLFLPYMLPLLLVYVAEYTINQGVTPVLLFPLSTTPFTAYREFYPAYAFLYQLGVFISRSSSPWIRIHNLYLPCLLQVLNLLLLVIHALTDIIPSVWIVFVVVFWEGLLGGAVYVNTFAEITENVAIEEREFSLSATTVSDSGGICIAAVLSMGIEKELCSWQVNHGRNWCRQR